MKVRMKTIAAGPKGTRQPGDVIDVPAKEAKTLIAGGFAEAVEGPAKPKAAKKETAADPQAKGREIR